MFVCFGLEVLGLPLVEDVEFDALVQKRCRLQVPRLVRWRHKLEGDEVFEVTVELREPFSGEVIFVGRMSGDGRLTIPEHAAELLVRQAVEHVYDREKRALMGDSVVGKLVTVSLSPVK